MKRTGGLYEKIYALDNLLLAFAKAQRRKQGKPDVFVFRNTLHDALHRMRDALASLTVQVGPYQYFSIHDPKERKICAAPFRDRVLHHAIMNICEPTFERYAIHHSYACRQGKGSHAAVRQAQRNSRGQGWYLKMDVAKYFDRIRHDLLLTNLQRLFKDRDLLDLLEKIIASYEAAPGVGIPIGNLTSQHFANYFLGIFDHFVTDELRTHGYVRYMDDMVLWGEDKRRLRLVLPRLRDFLWTRLALTVKDSLEIRPVTTGLNFLGFRIFPDRIALAHRARRRFAQKLMEYEKNHTEGVWDERTLAQRVEALVACTALADARGFRRKVIHDLGRSPQGSNRVNRGGSWNNDDSGNFRGANRNNDDPSNRNDNNGFRACLPPAQRRSW
jgi:hypothetical protein